MKIKKSIAITLAILLVLALAGCRSQTPTGKMIVGLSKPGSGKEWISTVADESVVRAYLQGDDFVLEGKGEGELTVNYYNALNRSKNPDTATAHLFTAITVDEKRIVNIVCTGMVDREAVENGLLITLSSMDGSNQWQCEAVDEAILSLEAGSDGSSFTAIAAGQGETKLVFTNGSLRVTLPVKVKADGSIFSGDATVE